MTENKKTTNRLDTRAKYETPKVWCFAVETEGVMAGSPIDFNGEAGENGIVGEGTENFFGSGGMGRSRAMPNSAPEMQSSKF